MDRVKIHKGNINFEDVIVLCGKKIYGGNVARLWRDVTCKDCIKERPKVRIIKRKPRSRTKRWKW